MTQFQSLFADSIFADCINENYNRIFRLFTLRYNLYKSAYGCSNVSAKS